MLEPNETWYGEEPYFDRIVIRTIENTAAMEAGLLSGSIDMISGEIGITIDQHWPSRNAMATTTPSSSSRACFTSTSI